MANNRIGNFIIKGIKDLIVRERTDEKSIVGDIDKLVDISVADTMATDYVRGGYSNPKLFTIYGDRDTTFTANNATISAELLAIMMNTAQSTGAKNMEVEPEVLELTSEVHIGNLKNTPNKVGLEVYVLDSYGKLSEKLTLVDNTPGEKEFSLNNKTLTFNEALVGKVKVFYRIDSTDAVSFEVVDITPKSYDMSGIIVVQEYESGKIMAGTIHMPNASIQPNMTLGGRNEATPPDAIALTIDLLTDEYCGYPYRISFDENLTVTA